jgi:hypothetical protein
MIYIDSGLFLMNKKGMNHRPVMCRYNGKASLMKESYKFKQSSRYGTQNM